MFGRLFPLELVCVFALAAVSCTRSADVDAHYRVRGLVESFSGSGDDARAGIRHERIEAFKDRDGKPSPMAPMLMNFALAPGVDPKALQPGAKVDLEFDVRWSSGSPLVITRVQALAVDTALSL
jgi:Copper binding periplasmic protein CusF